MDLLYEILHRPEYKNVTGLAEVLNVYLEEQYDILDEEDIKLKQEEDEVAYERKRLVDYVLQLKGPLIKYNHNFFGLFLPPPPSHSKMTSLSLNSMMSLLLLLSAIHQPPPPRL